MSRLRPTALRVAVGVFLLAGLAFRGDLITGMAAQRASAPASGDPPGPLVNPVVNAPDITARDTQSTTAIVRVPGTSIVVAAFNNSAVFTGSNNHLTGWARSIDDGTTWTDGGSLPASTLGDGGDPVLARDNVSGQLYLSTKTFSGSAVQVFRSTDNGASWLAPVNAAPGFGGGDILDTPWMTVDNFPGTGQGNGISSPGTSPPAAAARSRAARTSRGPRMAVRRLGRARVSS